MRYLIVIAFALPVLVAILWSATQPPIEPEVCGYVGKVRECRRVGDRPETTVQKDARTGSITSLDLVMPPGSNQVLAQSVAKALLALNPKDHATNEQRDNTALVLVMTANGPPISLGRYAVEIWRGETGAWLRARRAP